MQQNLKIPLSDGSDNETSFHNTRVRTTVALLRKALGQPDDETNDGHDKVNFEWVRKLDDGTIFTVYDWKEYRKLKETEYIHFHIGGNSFEETEKVVVELQNEIRTYASKY